MPRTRRRGGQRTVRLARLMSNDAANVYRFADGTFEMDSVALVEVPRTIPGTSPTTTPPAGSA